MASAATYTPIATQTLASNASSVSFTSIPQTYTDLVLVANVLGYYSVATYIGVGIQVGNGAIDTGTNYSSTMLSGDGSSAASSRATNAVSAGFWATALAADNGTRNTVVTHFLNYSNTTTYKTWLTRFNAQQTTNSTNIVGTTVNLWRNTAAINQISFGDFNGTNFYSGSTFTLYGIASA